LTLYEELFWLFMNGNKTYPWMELESSVLFLSLGQRDCTGEWWCQVINLVLLLLLLAKSTVHPTYLSVSVHQTFKFRDKWVVF